MKPPHLRVSRTALSDIVDLAGLTCLDGAAWWLHPVAGLAAAGALLLLIGRAVSR
ncbi:hypothetical protein [Kitasatospora sp. CB02891]|uniref:hypothetical protein n=1 Tax=Kitasatospora sp. CB02891 TaxID=2020329 RepID=UPI0018E28004|nr:hypothetical protein [Kitasatospora sp. CB02891]